MSGILCR